MIGVPALCSPGALTIGEFGIGRLVPMLVLTVFTPTPGRVVITSAVTRPYVLDPRPWQQADVERLTRRLRNVPVSEFHASSLKELRSAFPRVRLAWWHAHPWGVLVLQTAFVVGYFLAATALMAPPRDATLRPTGPQAAPRASRKPRSSMVNVGWLRRRTVAPQPRSDSAQPPPRKIRYAP